MNREVLIFGALGFLFTAILTVFTIQDRRDDIQDDLLMRLCTHMEKAERRGKLGVVEIECPPYEELMEGLADVTGSKENG